MNGLNWLSTKFQPRVLCKQNKAEPNTINRLKLFAQ